MYAISGVGAVASLSVINPGGSMLTGVDDFGYSAIPELSASILFMFGAVGTQSGGWKKMACPLGIGLYTSFFTLPPGGSSDSEGRAAPSPVFAFSLACPRPSPLVTSRPSRREGEISTIPLVLRCVETNARGVGEVLAR